MPFIPIGTPCPVCGEPIPCACVESFELCSGLEQPYNCTDCLYNKTPNKCFDEEKHLGACEDFLPLTPIPEEERHGKKHRRKNSKISERQRN